MFMPQGGRCRRGRRGADGRFELTFNDGRPGAIAGKHHVPISIPAPRHRPDGRGRRPKATPTPESPQGRGGSSGWRERFHVRDRSPAARRRSPEMARPGACRRPTPFLPWGHKARHTDPRPGGPEGHKTPQETPATLPCLRRHRVPEQANTQGRRAVRGGTFPAAVTPCRMPESSPRHRPSRLSRSNIMNGDRIFFRRGGEDRPGANFLRCGLAGPARWPRGDGPGQGTVAPLPPTRVITRGPPPLVRLLRQAPVRSDGPLRSGHGSLLRTSLPGQTM